MGARSLQERSDLMLPKTARLAKEFESVHTKSFPAFAGVYGLPPFLRVLLIWC